MYESCQYFSFFEDLKERNGQKDKGLADMDYWPNLAPGFNFYNENVHAHFQDKIINKKENNDILSQDEEDIIL